MNAVLEPKNKIDESMLPHNVVLNGTVVGEVKLYEGGIHADSKYFANISGCGMGAYGGAYGATQEKAIQAAVEEAIESAARSLAWAKQVQAELFGTPAATLAGSEG